MNINIGNRIGLILMAASLVGCGGGGGGSDPPVTPTRTLTGVTVSGNNTVTAGQTVQFQAAATFSTGAPETVTSSATWTSDNNGVATVNGSGLATGVAAGSTQIRAAHQNMSGSSPLQVNAAAAPPPPPTNTPPVASFVVTGPSGNNVCRLMVGTGGDFDCTFDGSASTGGSGGAVVQWTWRWDVLADSGGPVNRNVPTFKLSDQCGFFTGGEVTNTSVQMIVKLVVRNAAGVESAELRNSQVTLVHNDQCGF
jgi:hypothetical protein